MSSCWECEAETQQPFTVAIPTPADHPMHLVLCPTCYRTCYLSLALDISTRLLVRERRA
jgi:hypothetical protein